MKLYYAVRTRSGRYYIELEDGGAGVWRKIVESKVEQGQLLYTIQVRCWLEPVF